VHFRRDTRTEASTTIMRSQQQHSSPTGVVFDVVHGYETELSGSVSQNVPRVGMGMGTGTAESESESKTPRVRAPDPAPYAHVRRNQL
jgi:hypothetical protein